MTLYDEGVHWTCYCPHQPECCLTEHCCSGCDAERDHRVATDYYGDDEDCGSCSCIVACRSEEVTL